MLETCRDTGARGDLWLAGGSCLRAVDLGENIAASKLSEQLTWGGKTAGSRAKRCLTWIFLFFVILKGKRA